MDGILLIDKPKNMTSRDVVNIVCKKLNIKKIGHTGTLDPIATGVLVLCVGKATKLVDVITSYDKEYIATVVLGIKTDTLDISGNILASSDVKIEYNKINNILKTFKGTYYQEVPLYSAIKIRGKKLYQYARNSEDIILPKRKVSIKEIELIDDVWYEDNKTIFKIKVLVSKGTYIRSLINDIAKKLNTIGVMKELVRTKQGDFHLQDCLKIEIIDKNTNLIKIEKIINEFFIITVDQDLKLKIKNGAIIDNLYNKNQVAFIDENGYVIALYHTYHKDTTKLKPWKMFV